MNKTLSACVAVVIAAFALSGCNRGDDEAKKQMAQLQAQLDAEKAARAKQEAERNAAEQRERENALYEQAKEEAREELAAQASAAKAEQPKPKRAEVKFTEKIVRYPATVVTQSGYGQLALRGEPSSKGLEIGVVNDGEEVQVVARTNKCEILHGVDGCWVRVQVGAVKGYMFDGYLNREVLSRQEKETLQNGKGATDSDCLGAECAD